MICLPPPRSFEYRPSARGGTRATIVRANVQPTIVMKFIIKRWPDIEA
jgi:hypothetical protein